MKANVSRMVISAAAFGCVAVMSAPAAAVLAGPATVCATEQYNWTGQASLAAGESFSTGVTVPAQDGTQLQVSAVDVSASGATADVGVRIGQIAAADGATVSGGEIAAVNGGAGTLMVTGVSLSGDRCHQVDQEAPVVTASPAVTPAPAATTTAATRKAAVGALPNTGNTSSGVVVVAFGITAAGVALRSVSRRRRPVGA